MGKKIRYQYLTGSLLEPPLRYTKKLHIAINPISDPKGAQMARKWHVLGSKNREFFVQPSTPPLNETSSARWSRT